MKTIAEIPVIKFVTLQDYAATTSAMGLSEAKLPALLVELLRLHPQYVLDISDQVLKEGMAKSIATIPELRRFTRKIYADCELFPSTNKSIKHRVFITLSPPPSEIPQEFQKVLYRVRNIKPGETINFHYSENYGYFSNPYQLKQKTTLPLSFYKQGDYCYVTRTETTEENND